MCWRRCANVYHYDAQAREQAMSPEQRLRFHQEHSEPLMKGLHEWMEAQLAEHKTEPNSGLGKAISYLLNHWTKLTLFLRQAGAPIDNNIVERALKKAILNRKNALFYKTLNGAGVGDLFMSLIHTCELNGTNPFDYLTELLRHTAELKQRPSEWMPWNYRDTRRGSPHPPPRKMMILPGRNGSTEATWECQARMAGRQASESAKSHIVFGPGDGIGRNISG